MDKWKINPKKETLRGLFYLKKEFPIHFTNSMILFSSNKGKKNVSLVLITEGIRACESTNGVCINSILIYLCEV